MREASRSFSVLSRNYWDKAMVTMSSEYSIYLYRDKVDLLKRISGLSGIVCCEMNMNPNTTKSIYVFNGSNPMIKKILVRAPYAGVNVRYGDAVIRPLREILV